MRETVVRDIILMATSAIVPVAAAVVMAVMITSTVSVAPVGAATVETKTMLRKVVPQIMAVAVADRTAMEPLQATVVAV